MSPSLPDLRRDLEREVERVADRLAHLPAARLHAGSEPPRGELTRGTAQALADLAAELEGHVNGAAVPSRQLPETSDAALPDVLHVVAGDLLEAAARLADRVQEGRDQKDGVHEDRVQVDRDEEAGRGVAVTALEAGLARLIRLRQAL